MLPYSVVYPSVCPSVTFMHPAKAVGRNEMSFGTDIRVVILGFSGYLFVS